MHLTEQDKNAIVYLFTEKLDTVVKIAQQFGKSRQAIYDVLKQRGVKPKKCSWIDVTCDYCGKEFKRRRCDVRGSERDFCCLDHFWEYMREKKKSENIGSDNRHIP